MLDRRGFFSKPMMGYDCMSERAMLAAMIGILGLTTNHWVETLDGEFLESVICALYCLYRIDNA